MSGELSKTAQAKVDDARARLVGVCGVVVPAGGKSYKRTTASGKRVVEYDRPGFVGDVVDVDWSRRQVVVKLWTKHGMRIVTERTVVDAIENARKRAVAKKLAAKRARQARREKRAQAKLDLADILDAAERAVAKGKR